jgi:EAL domain-containing protein (putative c-di-GMP-specific phosphodiesterase class I)
LKSNTVTVEDILQALENEEFVLFYQPKISMITGDVCGAEALIRWPDADGGFLFPDAYIPLAEEAGIITQITKYVFSRLIRELPLLLASHPDLVVSFNASGLDFHDQGFTQFMMDAIKHQRYPVKNIEIEVTETVLLDENIAKIHLTELSEMGVPISMDDFGTGHSGLVELSKWPFSTVKIDRTFVNGIYGSPKNTEIVQAAIRMAHQLNIEVVAEGIEDKETFILLQKYGCKVGQGYWISKPIALTDFIYYLKDYKISRPFPIGVIYMAQLDHMQWKKRMLDAALYIHGTHQGNEAKMVQGGLPELDHTCCKLGRWYYSVEETFGQLKEYRELEVPHEELHRLGKSLLAAAHENCSIYELQVLINNLSKKSIIIIDLLQALENYWVIEQHKSYLKN